MNTPKIVSDEIVWLIWHWTGFSFCLWNVPKIYFLDILNQGLALPLSHLSKGQDQYLTMGGFGQYVVQFRNSIKAATRVHGAEDSPSLSSVFSEVILSGDVEFLP